MTKAQEYMQSQGFTLPKASDYGMVEVTEKDFVATIGKLNVHPTPVGPWHQFLGYRTEWKQPGGGIAGISFENLPFVEGVYMLPRS